jgi:osmotically-inducible protein OsmY
MAQETWISRTRPTVEARDGVLMLWGVVGSDAEKAALVTMARAIPGCKAIEDRLVANGAAYHPLV